MGKGNIYYSKVVLDQIYFQVDSIDVYCQKFDKSYEQRSSSFEPKNDIPT